MVKKRWSEAEECEIALKAALEVIEKSCKGEEEPSIQIRRGFPKESCRGFLINIGRTLEEILYDKDVFDILLADVRVFDVKRTRARGTFECEGRVTYLYLAKRFNINLTGLKYEWQNLVKSPRSLSRETILRELIGRTARMFPGFRIIDIEIKTAAVTPETIHGITRRADVDIVLRVKVYGSIYDLVEQEEQPKEIKLKVMYGKRGQSVEQIKKDLYTAYEQGYEKYVLIAENGEQVILNVEPLMREPGGAQFDKDLESYINRLLKGEG